MIKIDVSWLVIIAMLYLCAVCVRSKSVQDIKECMKTLPGEVCIKMHKGL